MSEVSGDTLASARRMAKNGMPADQPDARSVPHYLQSIALSLADIAESLRILSDKAAR